MFTSTARKQALSASEIARSLKSSEFKNESLDYLIACVKAGVPMSQIGKL